MKEVVAKLSKTTIYALITHIYLNTYLLKSVYFECRIIEISMSQENKLRKTYEEILLTKVNLSVKLYWIIIYLWKLALGLGLIKPTIAIKM